MGSEALEILEISLCTADEELAAPLSRLIGVTSAVGERATLVCMLGFEALDTGLDCARTGESLKACLQRF